MRYRPDGARRGLVCAGVSLVAMLFTMPPPALVAAADTPAIVVQANRTELRAGEWVDFYVTVASADATMSAVVDPLGVAEGFVRRLQTSEVALCRDGRCEPCPPGHRCFWTNTIVLDVRIDGDIELPFTFTDGAGRSFVTRPRFRVQPAPDQNGDGIPDAWAERYSLNRFHPHSGPDDDADGDGVSNRDEYRRGTNPRARYVRYFADASNGDRAPGLQYCFNISRFSTRPTGDTTADTAWITLIGDEGRVIGGGTLLYNFLRPTCPLERWRYPADRIVAAVVEAEVPFAVERMAMPGLTNPFDYSYVGSPGVEAPSTQWYFADGGADGEPDAFYLAFNPGTRPVEATITYRRDDGRLLLRRVRTLEPGRRTTIWVNADDAAIGRAPAFTEITSSAPILVERAWRFNPPGRTVTQALASPGVATASARWIFPEVDGGDGVETTIVLANPSGRDAIVDVALLFDDRDELRAGAVRVPANGRATIPARLLTGLSGRRASMELIARDGVRIVAERVQRGRDASGPWRMASAGAPEAGAEWTLAAITYGSGLVFTNVSNQPATLDLRSPSVDGYFDNPIDLTITVPPRRRIAYTYGGRPGEPRDPASPLLNSGTLRIERREAERDRADIVVELLRRGRADGPSREPASGIIGFRVR